MSCVYLFENLCSILHHFTYEGNAVSHVSLLKKYKGYSFLGAPPPSLKNIVEFIKLSAISSLLLILHLQINSYKDVHVLQPPCWLPLSLVSLLLWKSDKNTKTWRPLSIEQGLHQIGVEPNHSSLYTTLSNNFTQLCMNPVIFPLSQFVQLLWTWPTAKEYFWRLYYLNMNSAMSSLLGKGCELFTAGNLSIFPIRHWNSLSTECVAIDTTNQ